MQYLWNNEACKQFIANNPHNLPIAFLEQVYATRCIGSDPMLALHGGGNTSWKGSVPDILGDTTEALYIKASGCDMGTATADDFVALDIRRLHRLDKEIELDDDTMAAFFASSKIGLSTRQPSIETLLHAFLPFQFVTHSHPAWILALTNRTDSERCIKEAFSAAIVVIPYAQVGCTLAHRVAKAVAASTDCQGVVIAHHGLVTWGVTAREAYDRTIALATGAKKWLNHNRTHTIDIKHNEASVEQARSRYHALAPVIRGALSKPDNENGIPRSSVSMVLYTSETVLSLLEIPEFLQLLDSAPLTPDYIIRTGRLPLIIEHPDVGSVEIFSRQLIEYLHKYQISNNLFILRNADSSVNAPDTTPILPRVLFIPGIGAICSGNTLKDCRITVDITRQSLDVRQSVFESGGNWKDLEEEHCYNMEYRSYQKAKLSNHSLHPASGRVVLVTGAAGAIGSGLCHYLLGQGYQVAASDLPGQALEALVGELTLQYGNNTVTSVGMDVTSETSVHDGFIKIIDQFGGLDGVVVNAGIAYVATLNDMDFASFQRLERVNTEGTLLTIREAGRLFKQQNSGGDIVLISTKNVFAPGASFGAYSATKAAAHQIARIASLEFASIDVRVNMVAPDAVFSHGEHKSGLWATVGPGRMKSRGLDEKGLEEYYQNRNLLKAKVTASHVAAAVEFFLERRTPTSGATIPVDGGLPDATPR